jgi:hypothetical protein
LNAPGRIPAREKAIRAYKGWAKHVYTESEKKIRLTFGKLYCHLRYRFWKDVVFLDEHDVPYVSAKNWEGYMAQAREHVYKEEGVPYTNEHGIVRGKHMKKSWTGSAKYCVAMQGCTVLVAKSMKEYVKFGGPPQKRPPQPVNAHGNKIGRKRTRGEILEKPGSFCGRHYAKFLSEVAQAARETNHWNKTRTIVVYQDNLQMHYCPIVRKAADELNIVFFGDGHNTRPPVDSPDMNPIENLFHQANNYLLMREGQKASESQEVASSRFECFCRLATTGLAVEILVRSMPDRLSALVAAKGGATRY